MNKFYIAAIACACILFTGGCIIVSDNTFEPDKNAIPKEGRRVGGGYDIFYHVQEDGVISLVDQKSRKNIMSRWVPAGTKYEFSAATEDAKTLKQFGIDIKKADFVLYFCPDRPTPPQPVHQPLPPVPPAPPVPAVPPVNP